ncbi:MAG TPA: hypothetical protein PKM65_06355 [Spirochaetota bacterium]|nr:hypothetical protein [Spirochaetota bacterium]HNT10021.1 hypothetical protein [Spirochaetota bacterium]HNV46896.1 hypothetical protein [Spirochaetota bacterium]HPI22093.1 hypothetical protein [Spirochaetota bacterium]HPU87706.1 hypothetical protein [Spirochaetota bacterium]
MKLKHFASIALVAVFMVSLSACKKQEEKAKPEKAPTVALTELVKYLPKFDKAFKDLEFDQYSTTGTWLQINVLKKGKKDRVMWFQVFDQRNEQSTKDGYASATEKVGKYPAKVAKDSFVWILANNIEIRLVADDKNKEFKNTDKLKKFLEAFDLAGLEKL